MEFWGWEIGGGGGNTRDRKDWNFLQVQLEDYGERWQPVGGWENYSQRMQRSPIWLTHTGESREKNAGRRGWPRYRELSQTKALHVIW